MTTINGNDSDKKSILNKLLNFPIKSYQDLIILLRYLNQVVESQTSGIFIKTGRKLLYISAYGKNDFILLYQSLSIDESVEGHIFAGNDVIVEKSIEMPYFKPNSSSSNIVMPITIIGCPISRDNDILGGIIAFNRERNTLFTEQDLIIIRKVAMYVSDFIGKSKQPVVPDKRFYVLLKGMIDTMPFPAVITNTSGEIIEYSSDFAAFTSEESLYTRTIFNVIRLTGSNDTPVNFEQYYEKIIRKEDGLMLSNIRINDSYDKLYNLYMRYLNPERMSHIVYLYFLSTEDVNQAKNQIITSIAHELRTPLTAIMGSVQILQSDFASGELSPTQEEFLHILQNQSERFSSILSTILNFKESTDLGGLKQEKTDLRKIIEHESKVFKQKAKNSSISIKTELGEDKEMLINGEENSIKHILTQILDNAIKFSPENSEVSIVDEGAELGESKWYRVIRIDDNGPGIPKSVLPKIFESFTRDDEAVHSITGTGLGLSIVKQLMDTMGGEIEILNRDKGGTSVKLHFLT